MTSVMDFRRLRLVFVLSTLALAAPRGLAAPLPYVDAGAPKGGELRIGIQGTFDTTFPFGAKGQAPDLARMGGVPVDAVASFAHLWIGQKIGRPVTQAAAQHGQQLPGDRVQGIAAYTQGSYAQSRGQDQGGTFAHRFRCGHQETL